MVSFIVIGKNEAKNLNKCFSSIKFAIKENSLENTEIIYVDSNSSDNSIEIAKRYKVEKIILLTSIMNAAIARNIGASYALGKILVFLDGDMEINRFFLGKAINNGILVHPLIGGRVLDRLIDEDGQICSDEIHHNKEKSYFKPITGGAFIINTNLWRAIEGMDNRFSCGEDPELGLRLAQKGVLLKCLPFIFVIHNDNKTKEKKRQRLLQLLNFNHFYGSMLIYRKNLISKYTLLRLFSNEKSFIVLLVTILFSIFFLTPLFFILYLVAIIFRVIKKTPNNIKIFIESILYYLLRDITVLFGFLFFHPKKIKTELIPHKVIV